MRWGVLLVTLCLVLAGCTGVIPGEEATSEGETATPAERAQSAGADDSEGTSPGTDGDETTGERVVHTERPDPPEDRLGWENGYWHDDPVNVTRADGLNASERERVIARAMARVEQIRRLEFDETTNVTVRTRAELTGEANETANETTDANQTTSNRTTADNETLAQQRRAFRQFDNAKFEALYLVGTSANALETQRNTSEQTIGGYYSPDQGDIVLVADGELPRFEGEGTLAHELTHALQDQQFNLSASNLTTRDEYNGRNGLVEGDAETVEQAYTDRCGEVWHCYSADGSGAGSESGTDDGADGSDDSGETADESGDGIHLGIYLVNFFPYSDGPGFVAELRERGGWDAVDAAYDAPPTSSTAVIEPSKYGTFEPRNVTLTDRTSDGWERVRPPGRPDYATMGQSALAAMVGYTLYDDYNESFVVRAQAFLNYEDGEVRDTDPINYGLPAVQGWTGDRFHVYSRDNETGYVWRLTWESDRDAARFAFYYERLLAHWGGTQRQENVWQISGDSPFSSAVELTVEGDTVTIVNAPSVAALADVHGGSR